MPALMIIGRCPARCGETALKIPTPTMKIEISTAATSGHPPRVSLISRRSTSGATLTLTAIDARSVWKKTNEKSLVFFFVCCDASVAVYFLTAAAGRSAAVALLTCSVADHGELTAFGACVTGVAFGAGRRDLFGAWYGGDAGGRRSWSGIAPFVPAFGGNRR